MQSSADQDEARGTYRYPPLQFDDSIRLLLLRPGSFDDDLELRLVEVRLGERTAYQALSYVWGNPAVHTFAHVGDGFLERDTGDPTGHTDGQRLLDRCSVDKTSRTLGIAFNLSIALKHLRRKGGAFWFWVDAICIDQSNLTERRQQVLMMFDIYQSARRVLIWLGPSNERSKRAIQMLRRAGDLFAKNGYNTVMSNFFLGIAEENGVDGQDVSVDDSHDSSGPKLLLSQRVLEDLHSTFSSYGSITWWSRKWVVQELAAAKDAVVVCGQEMVNWRYVQGVGQVLGILFFRTYKSAADQDREQAIWQALTFSIVTITKLSNLTQRNSYVNDVGEFPNSGTVGFERSTFGQALVNLGGYQTTDLRDTVYALLSLCTFPTITITPDYTKTVVEVFVDALEALIFEWNNLDPICYYSIPTISTKEGRLERRMEEMATLPTWVPDVTSLFQQIPMQLYSACGSKRLDLTRPILPSRLVLRVRGFWCDKVVRLGLNGEEEYRSWKEQNQQVLDIDAINPSQAFVRALLQDRKPEPFGYVSGGRLSLTDIERYNSAYIELVHDGGHPAAEDESNAMPEDQKEQPPDRQDFLLAGTEIRRCVEAFEEDWLFCRMASGRFGWVPKNARVGDDVFIAYGAKVPLLLRPHPVSENNLAQGTVDFVEIGVAYVQGIMDGEMLADETWVEEHEMEILLH